MPFFTAVVKSTKNNTKIHKKHQKSTPKKNFNLKKFLQPKKKTPNLVLTPKCSEKTTRIYHQKNKP